MNDDDDVIVTSKGEHTKIVRTLKGCMEIVHVLHDSYLRLVFHFALNHLCSIPLPNTNLKLTI